MSELPQPEFVRGDAPKVYNYHRDTKEYLGYSYPDPSPEDHEWLYPAYCTLIAPPEFDVGQMAVFNRTPDDMMLGEWVIVQDHRGETWYTENGESVIIKQLGDPTEQGLLKEKPPEPEKPIEIPDSIGRRQFFQQAAVAGIITEDEALLAMTGQIPSVMNTAISALDKQYQFPAKALIVGSQTFERSNPLSATVAQSLGMSADDIEAFWLAASKL